MAGLYFSAGEGGAAAPGTGSGTGFTRCEGCGCFGCCHFLDLIVIYIGGGLRRETFGTDGAIGAID